MIQLKHKDINNPMFVDALRTLVNTPFHLKTSYHLGKIQDKIMQVSKEARTSWVKLMTERVEWEGEGQEKRPKNPEQFKKIEEEFLDIDVVIGKWNKVHVQDIHTAKLTPLQIVALEPILDGIETLVDGGESEKEDGKKS